MRTITITEISNGYLLTVIQTAPVMSYFSDCEKLLKFLNDAFVDVPSACLKDTTSLSGTTGLADKHYGSNYR